MAIKKFTTNLSLNSGLGVLTCLSTAITRLLVKFVCTQKYKSKVLSQLDMIHNARE